jgi:hypothetical protein
MSTSTGPTPAMRRGRPGYMAMQPAAPAGPAGAVVALPDGAGELIDAGGIAAVVKMSSGWDKLALDGVWEEIAPGRLIAAHTHAHTAQWSFVLSGTLVFRVGEEEHVVEAGGCIWRGAGTVHAVWNPGGDPARQLEFNIGGDMISYFRRREQVIAAGAGQEEIRALAAAYGLTFDDPLTAAIEAGCGVSVNGPWQ